MLGEGFNHNSVNVNQKENGAAVFIPAKDKADLYGKNHIFRTCAYCRVSTDNDAQLSSFELQQEHYQNLKKETLCICLNYVNKLVYGLISI